MLDMTRPSRGTPNTLSACASRDFLVLVTFFSSSSRSAHLLFPGNETRMGEGEGEEFRDRNRRLTNTGEDKVEQKRKRD